MANDVVPTEPVFSKDQLSDVKSFDDAIALLNDAGVETHSVTDYGDGFIVMDKVDFVNRTFLIMHAKVQQEGRYGTPFVILHVVRKDDGQKAVLVDGSRKSGIAPQVIELVNKGVNLMGTVCERGLVASTYTTEDENDNSIEATTYYIQGL